MRPRRKGWRHAWEVTTRGAGFEIAMLGLAMLGISAAIVATIRAATAQPGDLQFAAARDEISAIVQARGDGGFATPRRSLDSAHTGLLTFDSLVINADSLGIPSLARGGFLRDEVEAFNDAAVRNAWRSALVGNGQASDAEARSLLRLARTDSGTWVLSARLNPFTHNVQAPGGTSDGMAVRAADWSAGVSLVGLHGDATLATGGTDSPRGRVVSFGSCRMVADSTTWPFIYCGSSPGIGSRRQFDLRVTGSKANTLDGSLQLAEDRRTGIWVNGMKATLPGSARGGDLVFTSRMGPALLSETESGWLAGPQWVNGRVSYQMRPTGTLRWFARAGRSMPVASGPTLGLTVDAALTDALDADIAGFMQRHHGYLQAMSIVVMDVGSGALRSIAESDPADDKPLLALEPILVGSMSKPLMAAAILSRQPELARLSLARAGPEIEQVAGLRLFRPLGNPSNNCPATITFEAFLQCSSNQYAAELLMQSLQKGAGRTLAAAGGRIPDVVLEQSALAEGLLALFDDVVVAEDAPSGRSPRLWQVPGLGAASAVPRDLSLRPHLSRPTFVNPDTAGVPVDWLARYAIGGWEHRWTLVGALEAYARIATDRRVQLTVRQSAGSDTPRGDEMGRDAATAFRAVRRGLRGVATVGTAAGLDAALRTLDAGASPLVVMGKTGTLNEDADRAGDAGVFLKSLAIVVGRPATNAESAPLRCGLATIVYLQFRQDWRERLRLAEGSKLPNLHREFATRELAATLKAYWNRKDPCSGEGRAVKSDTTQKKAAPAPRTAPRR